jgi:cell division protein FtsQ
MKARRKELLNIQWVHDASIVRVWPNRIQVRIQERQPVAFVKLKAESMERWALIDNEGVILDPPHRAPFHLAMLAGIQPEESAAQRGVRVRRAERLLQELGGLAGQVSEADVSDLDDLKVTEKLDGRAVTLMLGDRNFSSKLQNFLNHYADIHRRIPQVTTFDLRLDDRITGVGAVN